MRVTTNALTGPVPAPALEPAKPKNSHTARTSRWGLDSRQIGSTVTYMGSEPNGNVLWMVSISGSRVGSYKYAPYGATTISGSAATSNPFRWIGAQQDTKAAGGAGHYKLGARYYDRRGHFTQPDSIAGGLEDPRTLSGYNYSASDPINQSDPSGYSWWDGAGGALGGAWAKYVAPLNYQTTTKCLPTALGTGLTTSGGAAATTALSGGAALPAIAPGFGVGFATGAVNCTAGVISDEYF